MPTTPKVLADICGKPLLQRLIERVHATPGISRVVVATTTESDDDVLADWCAAHAVPVYRGSVDDVLDRVWQCALLHPAEFIVRVTADDPLKDPEVIAQALALCASSSEVDYASNTLQPNVLKTYRSMYPGMLLGLSDHTPGHATVLGAVTLGARLVEKHFTDDVYRVGPDHKFSMDPKSWRDMVDRTRELEAALGNGIKKIEGNELETAVSHDAAYYA
jgi:GTP:adenosylcobinamide-phosphate guanylyltransferase